MFNLTVTDRGGLQSSAESVVYVLPADNPDEGSADNEGVNTVDDFENDAPGDSGAQQNNASPCFIGTTWHPQGN